MSLERMNKDLGQRHGKKLTVCVLAVLVLNVVACLTWESRVVSAEEKIEACAVAMKGTIRGIIHIESNSQFTAANGVVGGSGTENDPYIIEGWVIDANGNTYCIWIENTDAYFVIKNCNVYNATDFGSMPPSGSGIALKNVTHGRIENNTCNRTNIGIYLYGSSKYNLIANNNVYDNFRSIYLSFSSNNTILGNNLTHNNEGIDLQFSSSNSISYNNVSDNSGAGISIGSSSNDNNITHNNVSSNSQGGISLWSSNNNNIAENYISGNAKYAIYLESSTDTNITNNIMYDNWIAIEGKALAHWNTHNIDTTNLVNGKPVYYYKNRNGETVPSDAGQVILANSTNIIINGLSMSNAPTGIQLGFSDYNTITRNNISGVDRTGIFLYSSNNNNITQNNLFNCYPRGIFLELSNGNHIENNNLSGNMSQGMGIFIHLSNNNKITNNTVSGNCESIYLLESSENIITNNTVYNNTYGIALYNSGNNKITNNNVSGNSDGIYLYSSSNNNITGNNASNSFWYSISLDTSDNNIIANNNASSNSWYGGIFLMLSSRNLLTNNTMENNGIVIMGSDTSHWTTQSIDTTNLVNGKPVYYYRNHNGGTVPSDAGQVILANCNAMTVANLNISNTTYGIQLVHSSNITIQNSKIVSHMYGIWLKASCDNRIVSNDVSISNFGSEWWYRLGIVLEFSDNNNLSYNYIHGHAKNGIYLTSSGFATLTNNSMDNNGIVITGVNLTDWNTHNIDTSNLVNGKPVYYYKNQNGGRVPADAGQVILANSTNMFVYGLSIHNTSYGIQLGFSDNNNILNNNISDNTGHGICLASSNNNTITYNWLCNNTNYGVAVISPSTSNKIHHNNFIGNGATALRYLCQGVSNDTRNDAEKGVSGNSQAYDDVGGNYWYDNTSQEGNYWSNWDGNDWGTENAYRIGYCGSVSDWYPLSTPVSLQALRVELNLSKIELHAGENANFTVRVYDDGNTPLPNATVTIELSNNSIGTLNTTTKLTDADGKAVFEFTASTNVTTTTIVKITATATKTGYAYVTNSANLTIKSPEPLKVTISVSKEQIDPGNSVKFSVTVYDYKNAPVSNATVTIELSNNSIGTLNTTTKLTDADGRAVFEFTASTNISATTIVTITAMAGKAGYVNATGSANLTVKPTETKPETPKTPGFDFYIPILMIVVVAGVVLYIHNMGTGRGRSKIIE
ncbi:MAG: NosD domain-containing protein [Thermoplasmata archaeon]